MLGTMLGWEGLGEWVFAEARIDGGSVAGMGERKPSVCAMSCRYVRLGASGPWSTGARGSVGRLCKPANGRKCAEQCSAARYRRSSVQETNVRAGRTERLRIRSPVTPSALEPLPSLLAKRLGCSSSARHRHACMPRAMPTLPIRWPPPPPPPPLTRRPSARLGITTCKGRLSRDRYIRPTRPCTRTAFHPCQALPAACLP